MNRRGILAACAAPAIVKAELLMPVRKIIVPAYTCFVPVDVYAEILKHEDTVPAKLYAGEVGVISHGIRFIESSRLYR